MPDLSGLGDLVLTVGGDISPLEQSLNQIPSVAQQSAAQIQAAFDAIPSATDEVETSMANLSRAVQDAGTAATEATAPLTEMTQGVSDGAREAAHSIGEMPPALHDTANAANDAGEKLAEFAKTGLELAGVALSLEGIKAGIEGSLEAFGKLQDATVALTAITGKASEVKEALEGLPELADRLGVSLEALEGASITFSRFGVQLQQMPALFSAIADAARGSGQSFDIVASAWERIIMGAPVMTRSLMSAGLSTQDLAKAMGLDAATSAKELTKALADAGDGAGRAAVLMKAVPDSLKGLAESSDTVTKSTQQLSNAWTEAKENIGEAITDLAGSSGFGLLKDAIKGLETAIVSMIGWFQQAIDLVRGFGTIAIDEFKSALQAVTDFGDALNRIDVDVLSGNFKQAAADAKAAFAGLSADLKSTDEKINLDFETMGAKMTADWTSNGKIIDNIWKSSTASVSASTKGVSDSANALTGDLGKLAGAHKAAADAAGGQKTELDQVKDAMDQIIASGISSNIQQQAKDLLNVADSWKLAQQNIKLNQQALDDFTGSALEPIQIFDQAAGKAVALANGIEMIAGSAPKAADAVSLADVKITTLGEHMQVITTDAASFTAALNEAAGAAQQLADDASIAADAASSMLDALNASMPVKGSAHVGLGPPGSQFSEVFTGNPFQLVGVGGIGIDNPPTETQTVDPLGFFKYIQGVLKNLGDPLGLGKTTGSQLQSAAVTLNEAATNQLTAADQAKLAAGAIADAAKAAQAANDSISASTLAAADAANALALAGDAVVSTVQSTAAVVAGATAIVVDVAAKAGIPGFTSGGSNALSTALTSAPSLPSLGPSGANTMVPMVPFTPGYSPYAGSGPQVTVNAGTVVGANGMNDLTQMIQKALVDMLNQQGIRVVRG